MVSNAKKRSSARNEYDSDDGFVASDSDDQGRLKRVKTKKDAPDTSNSTQKVDSNGDVYWQISNLRRVTISAFRGKTMVNIREYYEKDGQELPGKKGITLPMEQFSALIRFLPDIEDVLSQKGESVPRADYSKSVTENMDSSKDSKKGGKKNIEATSDEDNDED